ncbi:hypothetical protein CY34DRAFT_808136 [Suillus luteus UH-Slu-Lm8-n1]|uniref:DUF6533 domain-containing protein n=1 Tax=Suillus luteus UH-Slu-Lm8-n1 TaxID=930992 RepID=A0A0D0ANK5_9AGAM|nr:hypothetical protein CY34DRAFT_808136 [Suillus luteus UH-Slu-Lm8-n1]
MTLVSNDPAYWPLISVYRVSSYSVVASVTAVAYDWVLTSGQEFELLWRRRWSLMTVLYFCVRFIGILYSVYVNLTKTKLILILMISLNIACANIFSTQLWMSFVVNAMLSVIMITRLYAMYQRSRKMLIFIVITFVAVTIACGVIAAVGSSYLIWEELVIAGTHQCFRRGEVRVLTTIAWVIATMWEILALCLAVWIAVRHLRELQQFSRGRRTISNWFTALIKTHVLYFAAYAAVSCFTLGYLSPKISKSYSVGSEVYIGILEITTLLQMFVLGPRLMLSVREYHAKLETNYDDAIAMTTIAFQEHVHVSEA